MHRILISNQEMTRAEKDPAMQRGLSRFSKSAFFFVFSVIAFFFIVVETPSKAAAVDQTVTAAQTIRLGT